ncbi:GTP cyclohydrolase [marine bacterium AO1-C]|nr:GTP cyclohydrolase [marine bacterium AO1-C]
MSTINYFKKYSVYALLAVGILFTGCKKDEDDPAPENELEVITDVKLIFTNTSDATDIVTARAQDADGPGVGELAVLDPITLGVGKTYTLTYEIFNNLETPGENIGDEIKEEDDEHQFFFSFSDNAFSNPMGNGNIDNASDPINYNDTDGTNPVGLMTTWTTSTTQLTGGTFTVRLQHQPGVKTATSGATDGDTDFNLQFVLNIQ